MKTMRIVAVLGVVMAVVAGIMITGCETTETTDNAMTVSPDSAIVTNDVSMVTFTASLTSSNVALILPLIWSVGDASMGHIRASDGVTAVYESTSKTGNNTVHVRDQGDSEGVATVSHERSVETPGSAAVDPAENNALLITPDNVLLTNLLDTVTLVVTGSKVDPSLPLVWSVGDSSLGDIISSGGHTAIYQCRNILFIGNNVIRVSDQKGATGVASVKSR